jgi:dihydrofolate reductase
MRQLILKMSISIDGFVGAADGGIKWIFDTHDDEAAEWTVRTISDASLHIMGSRTFHDMAAYWPTSTEIFAPPMNQIPKAVFSKQGASILPGTNTTAALSDARANARPGQHGELQPGADSWAHAYVASGDLQQEIAKLKAQNGKPIIAHGGASFARSLVALDLVDQYVLLVHPVALGKGLPLFAGVTGAKILKLLSSTVFPRGTVAQIYSRNTPRTESGHE